jgi:hypothetical protein
MDDSEENQLPHTARSLCKEAVEIGTSFMANIDEDVLAAEIEEYLQHAVHLTDIVESGTLSIDATNILEVFDTLSNEESANNLIKELNTGSNPELAKSLSTPSDPKIGIALIGWSLVALVLKLKEKEESLLKNSKSVGFVEIMSQLDKDVTQIASLLSDAKAFMPGMELITTKLARSKGAQKGGQVRKEKFSEMRMMVIDEARSLHADKKGAKAAREIHASFSTKENLLNDENGKPLSVDPVPLFTRWINEDRKEPNSTE